MIPTEEQRGALAHAINYIDETDLPVGELDGFDREVLRAMIDSSDPIPDVTELVELLAAGEHEQWAVWAQAILDSEPGLSDRRKATWPEMIATPYENLSEELKDEDRRVVYLRSQAALDYIQQQSTEIERLRGDLADSENRNEDLRKGIDDLSTTIFSGAQTTRIKALEDALVEERVIGEGGFRAGQCEFWYIEDLPEESCMELDGPCDWATCPKKQELRDIARKQLQAEGKIGPDADAKPHCWQITEERILAIENAISSCVLIERYTGQDLRQETTALRAMLTEAGQK